MYGNLHSQVVHELQTGLSGHPDQLDPEKEERNINHIHTHGITIAPMSRCLLYTPDLLILLSLLWDRGLQRQPPPGSRNNIDTLQKNPLTLKQEERNMCVAWRVTLFPWTPLVPAEPYKVVIIIHHSSFFVHLSLRHFTLVNFFIEL